MVLPALRTRTMRPFACPTQLSTHLVGFAKGAFFRHVRAVDGSISWLRPRMHTTLVQVMVVEAILTARELTTHIALQHVKSLWVEFIHCKSRNVEALTAALAIDLLLGRVDGGARRAGR